MEGDAALPEFRRRGEGCHTHRVLPWCRRNLGTRHPPYGSLVMVQLPILRYSHLIILTTPARPLSITFIGTSPKLDLQE